MGKEKEKFISRTLGESVRHACDGLKIIFQTQANIKIQGIIAIIVMIMAYLLRVSKIELLFLVFTIFLVFLTEIINTAIEEVVNLYTEKYHEKAKTAKDIAAGAVIASSVCAIITGVIIFYDKIF